MNERNKYLIADAIKIIDWCEANVPKDLFGEKVFWQSEDGVFCLSRGRIGYDFFKKDKRAKFLLIEKECTRLFRNGEVDNDGLVWYAESPQVRLNVNLNDDDICFEVIEYFIKNWESIKSKILENIDAELDRKRKEEDFENLIINFNP